MSLTDLGSIIAMVTSIAAIAGLIVQLRGSAIGLQTQVLLDMEDRFYSDHMRTCRQNAARQLIENAPHNPELEDTLDFLHSVVMLVERKVVDRALAIEFYKYWIARYWLASKEYVASLRRVDDPNTYSKLQKFAEAIIASDTVSRYDDAAMRAFLKSEARIAGSVVEPKLLVSEKDKSEPPALSNIQAEASTSS
jgi:hypothetical protein